MPLITWSPDLEVGVAQFNEHHKKLVALINKLNDAMAAGKGQKVIGEVLDELIQYTVYHFGEEEKLLAAHNYPELAKHKAEHVNLTKKALELVEKQKAGHVAITIPVMQFLREWLSGHIKGTDKKYGLFLNQKGVN